MRTGTKREVARGALEHLQAHVTEADVLVKVEKLAELCGAALTLEVTEALVHSTHMVAKVALAAEAGATGGAVAQKGPFAVVDNLNVARKMSRLAEAGVATGHRARERAAVRGGLCDGGERGERAALALDVARRSGGGGEAERRRVHGRGGGERRRARDRGEVAKAANGDGRNVRRGGDARLLGERGGRGAGRARARVATREEGRKGVGEEIGHGCRVAHAGLEGCSCACMRGRQQCALSSAPP